MNEPGEGKPDYVALTELQRLYQAAAAFGQAAPWEWMEDDKLFGVKDPESGEIGYCAVLGILNEIFALVVYEGREGYDGWQRMSSRLIQTANHHLIEWQHALVASFENRGAL